MAKMKMKIGDTSIIEMSKEIIGEARRYNINNRRPANIEEK